MFEAGYLDRLNEDSQEHKFQDNEFGLYLKEIREKRNMSIRKLQELSGVSNAYISQIENGLREIPSPEIIRNLSFALNVDYGELMMKAGYLSDIPVYEEWINEIAHAPEHKQKAIQDIWNVIKGSKNEARMDTGTTCRKIRIRPRCDNNV